MHLLGIETSCDETAAAILHWDGTVRANIVHSQIPDHAVYGGVVPEVAARQHVARLPGIVRRAFQEANLGWADVDAIAVTHGPGLASSLLVGLTAAKTLALRMGKTLLPVNHLEGHVCSLFLGDAAIDSTQACPMLVLLVTGGHTCLIGVERPGVYRMLGRTLDDAAGEALDKGAKLLGLGYPGGPAIERVAATGSDSAVRFPIGTHVHAAYREMCMNNQKHIEQVCLDRAPLREGGPSLRAAALVSMPFLHPRSAIAFCLRSRPEEAARKHRRVS